MKALTIRQPYASLVAMGQKQIETRSWSTSYRGYAIIAIHGRQRFYSRGPALWTVCSRCRSWRGIRSIRATVSGTEGSRRLPLSHSEAVNGGTADGAPAPNDRRRCLGRGRDPWA
mgnify:CR=1 FL=1